MHIIYVRLVQANRKEKKQRVQTDDSTELPYVFIRQPARVNLETEEIPLNVLLSHLPLLVWWIRPAIPALGELRVQGHPGPQARPQNTKSMLLLHSSKTAIVILYLHSCKTASATLHLTHRWVNMLQRCSLYHSSSSFVYKLIVSCCSFEVS